MTREAQAPLNLAHKAPVLQDCSDASVPVQDCSGVSVHVQGLYKATLMQV